MKRLFIFLVVVYQKTISPYLGPSCRFIPSCSEYAKIAIGRHGVIKGSVLALWRILRCNPLSKKIYDPVPYVVFGTNKRR